MNVLKLTFGLIFFGISPESNAQTTKSEPIFGSVVERKVSKDSTKKKIIATAETGYQVPFNAENSNGGLSVKVGVAYQFSKKLKSN